MLILRSPTLYEILCSKLNSISLYSCVNWEVSLLLIDKILTKNRIQNTKNESQNIDIKIQIIGYFPFQIFELRLLI